MSIIYHPDGRVEHYRKSEGKDLALYQIGKLKELRDDFSDEIPSRIIHSTDPDNKYKVTGAWWGTLGQKMLNLENGGILKDDMVSEYRRIFDVHNGNLKKNNGLTTAEDITTANSLINNVISYLETYAGSSSDKI